MRWVKLTASILVGIVIGVGVWFYWPVTYPTLAPRDQFQGERVTPAGPIQLFIMTVGYSADADYRDLVERGEPRTADLPTFAYLVDHPQGKVLIDSGYGRRFEARVEQFPYWLVFDLIRPRTPRAWALECQLGLLGIRLEDITHIVLTHAHNDHAGGVQDCPRARIYLPRAEWEDATRSWRARWRGFMPEQLEGVEDRLVFVEYTSGPYGTFDQSFDLFGDGSIILVGLPGHTAGSQGVFVNLPSGKRFFFTGDAAWVDENYRTPAPKGRLARRLGEFDEVAAWESLQRIRKLAELAPDLTIVPGHEPRIHRGLKRLPEFYQ